MLLRSVAVLEAQGAQQCLERSLAMDIAAELRAALAEPPLELPKGHNGDRRVLMHRLVLSHSQAAHMVALFRDGTVAEPAPGKSWAGFQAAWLEHYTYVGTAGCSMGANDD